MSFMCVVPMLVGDPVRFPVSNVLCLFLPLVLPFLCHMIVPLSRALSLCACEQREGRGEVSMPILVQLFPFQ